MGNSFYATQHLVEFFEVFQINMSTVARLEQFNTSPDGDVELEKAFERLQKSSRSSNRANSKVLRAACLICYDARSRSLASR